MPRMKLGLDNEYDPRTARGRDLTQDPTSIWYGFTNPNMPALRSSADTATTTPEDPFAWAKGFQDVGAYASAMRTRGLTRGTVGPNPMPAAPVAMPGTQGTLFVNPFNPTGGAGLTKEQYENLANQIGMIHQPTSAEKGRGFVQMMTGAEMGAGGPAPTPMRSLMGSRQEALDDIMREAPESVSPVIAAKYKQASNMIRERFAQAMTRYGGKMTVEDVFDIGDNLSRDFPTHPGFIRDLLQSQIQRIGPLNTAYQNWLGERTAAPRGNLLFQNLPPVQQVQVRKFAALADKGIINKQMATEMGLVEGGTDPLAGGSKGQYGTIDETGKFVPAKPAEIAAAYRDMYELEETPAAMPQGPAPVTIAKMLGTGTGSITTAEGKTISAPTEKELVLSDGTRISAKKKAGSITADEVIGKLRATGKPEDEKLAQAYEKFFGVQKLTPEEVDAYKRRKRTGGKV